jgi:translocation and assembly module TamB
VRPVGAALRGLGWAVLGALALVGLSLSALMAFTSSPWGRPVVASRLIRILDDEVAGRLELGGVALLPGGRISIRDFKAYDPDGQLVLQVDRVLVSADVTRLRSRSIGIEVELDGAAVLVDEDADGRLSLERAFAPAHPGPPTPPRELGTPWRAPLAGWTVRLRRLVIANAALWWRDAAGNTRIEAQDLEVSARAIVGPGRSRAELRLRGDALSPVAGPVALDLRATLDGDRLQLPLLSAQLGGTSVAGLAAGDLARRTGQAALTRATVDRAQARALVKGAPAGADLVFEAYADADGKIASAAVHVEPQGRGTGGGEAAVAVRVDGARALGFDVLTRALDPATLLAGAPRGSVTLEAHGGLAGTGFASAAGNLELSLSPSTLRGGAVGPATASVSLAQGSWTARRIALTAPGLTVNGQGSWRQGGAASGRFTGEVSDLARAAENAGKLLAVALPRMGGRGRVEAELSGTAAAPVLAARVTAPALTFGGTAAAGVEARVDAAGPFRPGSLKVNAAVRRLTSGEQVLAQALTLEGELRPDDAGSAATLAASGLVPSLGKEPVSLDAAAALPRDGRTLRLTRLAIAYPGTRYALEEPATVALAGPRVDRLSLASGPRRIAVSGGLAPGRTLDARLELVKLDLARLPVGVLPAGQGIAGDLSADATVTGPLARPVVQGRVAIAGAGFRSEQGAALEGTARWDGGARRIAGRVALRRGPGGTVDVEADLPLPLRGRGAEPVSATVRTGALPLPAILALAGTEARLQGLIDAELRVRGTAAAPTLQVQATVKDGAVLNLEAIGLQVTADVGASTTAHVDLQLSGRPAARVEAYAPLALAALLADPGRIVDRLGETKVTGRVAFPGVDVAAVSGRLHVPPGIRGRLSGEVAFAGRPLAPRGTVALTLEDGAWHGYTAVGARIEGEARDERIEARVSASLAGQELLQLTASLGVPVERLYRRAGVDAAPVRIDGTVPLVDLGKAPPPSGVALAGMVQAKLHAEGTIARPSMTLDATGRGVRIEGRPVGDLQLAARSADGRATASLTLTPPAGGKLTATAVLQALLSLDVAAADLRRAPAELRVRADAVDLGFVPALLPGAIRSAAGRLDAEVTATGPFADLTPRGTVQITGGRLGLLDYGDWTGIALDGAVTADAVELRRLEARRGEGKLTARAALRGLDTPRAVLDGRLDAEKVSLNRAGSDLATVSLGVKASGSYQNHKLEVRLDLPSGGLVRLADKLPRELQPLDRRPDIIVGERPPRRPAEPGAGAGEGSPFTLSIRAVVPGKLAVQRDVPRIRLEFKADVTYERQGGGEYMTGTVEVVRGSVEPISDRRFDVKRGRVSFTGGPPLAAVLDVEATYDNPAAQVIVDVTGPLTKPDIALKSQPPLDDSQIAMLIATGQAELKAGGGGAAAAGQSELSQNTAQKLGFAVFNTFVRNQLPFSTGDVSLDASSARVSGYIPGTPVYVGYTRRFEANRQLGENENEVRVEYAISPHWSLEGRWGTSNTGGASLIWSRDY